MRHKAFYSFIALTTFAVSSLVATFIQGGINTHARYLEIDSFQISDSSRYSDFTGSSGCLKKLGFRLGDSYSKVSKKASLIPDSMGWNENESWRFGKNTDFRGSLPDMSLTDENKLYRWVYAEFDDHQRLLSISISWQLGFDDTRELRKLVINEVFKNQTDCNKPNGLNISSNDFNQKTQRKDYLEKLRVSQSTSIWSITYTIQHRNSNWFSE